MCDENANREYKDSVFNMLFKEPDVLRELYSAIEGVNLPEDIPININTLTDVLFRGKLNDISFTIDNKLVVIIEHQSTINENMPIRILIYLSEIYKKIVNQRKIFQKNLFKIQRPEFIVLYNGSDPYDDYKELRLSDAFMETEGLKTDDKLPLELIVKVYNVNMGRNPEMLARSKNLRDYSIFMGKIWEYRESELSLEKSIKAAVKYCEDNGILKDFLEKHRSEVTNMILQDLTAEEWRELDREEAMEEGLAKGEKKGIGIGEQNIINLLKAGKSPEDLIKEYDK